MYALTAGLCPSRFSMPVEGLNENCKRRIHDSLRLILATPAWFLVTTIRAAESVCRRSRSCALRVLDLTFGGLSGIVVFEEVACCGL